MSPGPFEASYKTLPVPLEVGYQCSIFDCRMNWMVSGNFLLPKKTILYVRPVGVSKSV